MRLVSWKSGNAIAVCVMAIVLGQLIAPVSAFAAGRQDQQPPAGEQAKKPAQAETPKPQVVRPSGPIPAMRNIAVEITITD